MAQVSRAGRRLHNANQNLRAPITKRADPESALYIHPGDLVGGEQASPHDRHAPRTCHATAHRNSSLLPYMNDSLLNDSYGILSLVSTGLTRSESEQPLCHGRHYSALSVSGASGTHALDRARLRVLVRRGRVDCNTAPPALGNQTAEDGAQRRSFACHLPGPFHAQPQPQAAAGEGLGEDRRGPRRSQPPRRPHRQRAAEACSRPAPMADCEGEGGPGAWNASRRLALRLGRGMRVGARTFTARQCQPDQEDRERRSLTMPRRVAAPNIASRVSAIRPPP